MRLASTLGPLVKARETVRVFARNRPSLRDLLTSRRGTFDRAHAILPSDVVAGEGADLTVQVWDEYERLHGRFSGTFRVESTDPEATLPDRVRFPPGDGAVRTVDVGFETPGTHYVTLVHEATGERFVANPVRVHESPPDRRVLWGDIHVHSSLSDGTASMATGFRFARDVMRLDVCAYTDHDTMGFFIPPQLQRRRMHREYFERMCWVSDAFDEAGEFVTLPAYEWTKQPNMGGHLNVYFDSAEHAELFDSLAPETNTYEALWDRLREYNESGPGRALTIPHHPAEAMYPFDFADVDYDDDLAPLVEVYSQWGNSERPGREGNPYPLEMGQGEIDEPGHYAQDALALGHRVGLVASSDYHGPHPGHSLIHAKPHLPSLDEWRDGGLGWSNIWRAWNEQSYPGGLQAFVAPEHSRTAVFDAMQNRAVYGTTQPHRILVEFAVGDVAVGDPAATVHLDGDDPSREVSVSVAGTAPLETVTVVKNNEPWQRVEGDPDADPADLDAYTVTASWVDDEPVTGIAWDGERGSDADVYYLRVGQVDGGMAWAGPVWVEPA